MTILTGIKNASYLAQFLGGRIAIKEGENQFGIYHLTAIFAGKNVQVTNKAGDTYFFEWSECENPYIVLTNPLVEWSMR